MRRAGTSQPATNVTRGGLTSANSNTSSANASNVRRNSYVEKNGGSEYGRDGRMMDGSYRMDNQNIERIPPRSRDYILYDHPSRFWDRDPHYFGYRVEYLPPRYRTMRYYGIDYYVYNDIYYRSFGGVFYVCRPPVGILLARTAVDLALAPVRFAYYVSTYSPYTYWDSYYSYIDTQNRTIARNNAIIAQQNAQIAMNSNLAANSYNLANRLGLNQSYAYANSNYYYDDGVFYIINSNGRYEVIVPPAGAVVEALPDDYDTITLSGATYYVVDNTVYTTTLIEGRPYMEVLGQLTSRSRYYNYGYVNNY